MGRNLTLNLSEEMIKSAKILAIEQNKSLSQMFREYFEHMVNHQTAYKQSVSQILKWSQKGLYALNGQKWSREDLYDR